jgi:hypothetical protein
VLSAQAPGVKLDVRGDHMSEKLTRRRLLEASAIGLGALERNGM